MAIQEGTLVLVGIERVPKTPIGKFTPGIVRQGTNDFGHCLVRFNSASSPQFSNVVIGMGEDCLVPLLRLSEEERDLDPQDAFQRHQEDAVRRLAEMYIGIASTLRTFAQAT